MGAPIEDVMGHSLGEKADGDSGNDHHRMAKRHKRRVERRKVKDALKKGKEPINSYGRYRGWEM